MRLIDVAAILDVEEGIDQGNGVNPNTEIIKWFCGPDLEDKEYAILSHCWGVAKQGEKEVSFKEMTKLLLMDKGRRNEIRGRTGYKKIVDTCKQAKKDGLEWAWVDTCCIDKRSSSELSESINSMYQWYKNAKQCYNYLHDTVGDSWTDRRESTVIPKWFSRGWTLQELIAPKLAHFFDQKWEFIGDKTQLADSLSVVARVPAHVLKYGLDGTRPSVAQVMSWAADRTTTREEDRAYSLLGLLGVHMPMLYGEGKNAFRRLQLEIIRMSNDHSIFAWGHTWKSGWSSSFLADDPSWFRDCGSIELSLFSTFVADLKKDLTEEEGNNFGRLWKTFTVTNNGIKIRLPTITHGSISQVILACSDLSGYPKMIAIHLVVLDSTCFRIFGIPNHPGKMEFKQHFLPYTEARYPTTSVFELQYPTLSHNGFVLDCVVPEGTEVKDTSITLSEEKDFAAISYVRREDDTRFLVLLSNCGPRRSAFTILSPENFEQKVAFLRRRALQRLVDECSDISPYFIKHAHFRRSIQGARVIYGATHRDEARCMVTIDIARCPGCCTSVSHATYDLIETGVPGLMRRFISYKSHQAYNLSVNSFPMDLVLVESETKVGDYGCIPHDGDLFKPEGNISEFAPDLAIDPVKNFVSGMHTRWMQENLCIASPFQQSRCSYHRLALYDATGWSLPVNQQLVSLLKELSFHLAGKLLVTTIIKCSECHILGADFKSGDVLGPETWQKFGTSTPLCSLMMPMSWHQVDPDEGVMDMFLNIIHNFSVLAGWTDEEDEVTVSCEGAVKFFLGIFGGCNFNDFVGEIAFFNELPLMMEPKSKSCNEPCTKTGNASPTQGMSEDREVMVVTQKWCIGTLVPYLPQEIYQWQCRVWEVVPCCNMHVHTCKIVGRMCMSRSLCPSGSASPRQDISEDREVMVDMQEEQHIGILIKHLTEFAADTRTLENKIITLVSAPFAAVFLQIISTIYEKWEPSSCGLDTKFDRCNFLSVVEEIKMLQKTLSGTNEDHLRHAMVEDIAGKILLICWHGVTSEITQVLRKVIDCYVNGATVEQHMQTSRANNVHKVGMVLRNVINYTPDDGQGPLERVIGDAAEGTSKYQLLLAELAEQATQLVEVAGVC